MAVSTPDGTKAPGFLAQRKMIIGSSMIKYVRRRIREGAAGVCFKSGATVPGMISIIEEKIATHVDQDDCAIQNIDLFMIYLGGNDIGKGDEPREIIENYKLLINLLKENSKGTIYISEILPRKGDSFNNKVKILNEGLSQMCDEKSVIYKCADKDFFLEGKPNQYCFEDSVHITPDATDGLIRSWGMDSLLKYGEIELLDDDEEEDEIFILKIRPQSPWVEGTTIVAGIPDEWVNDVDEVAPRSTPLWVITVTTQNAYEYFLKEGITLPSGEKVACYDANEQVRSPTTVSVTKIPSRFKEDKVKKFFENFGEVKAVNKKTHPNSKIGTGETTIDMVVIKPIPRNVQMTKKVEIVVKYRGQRPACHLCQEYDHFAAKCPNKPCYICKKSGHYAEDCKYKKKCDGCQKWGHLIKDCHKQAACREKARQEIQRRIAEQRVLQAGQQTSSKTDPDDKDKKEEENTNHDLDPEGSFTEVRHGKHKRQRQVNLTPNKSQDPKKTKTDEITGASIGASIMDH